ncbi:MAG: RNA polymerase sigma factor [Mariniphaga sp.]|nr:RNA polymerase sigma factor [Mariniphaga sp.]
MPNKSEIILVRQCRKGNVKAQYKLYRLYAKGMFNVAVRMVGDSQAAEDILQEAFIKVFKGLDKLKNDAAFGGWLKRIVINLCIDYSRKERFVFIEIDDLKSNDLVVEEIDEDMDTALVHKLIKKLPEGARQILVMRALEGYKHAEIGEELGISESTAKTQFFRARHLLAKMIKEEWYEDKSGKISERKTTTA